MTPSTTTPRTGTAGETDGEDDQMELFMRHSSPIDRPSSNQPSPLTVRNSSPSPMDLSRPRSNPRNRTPMRFESPLGSDAFQIPEGEEETVPNTNEGRRITILPMAGSARGTNIANFRVSQTYVSSETNNTTSLIISADWLALLRGIRL
jgi:hypothetical protein